ncbi:MAG TPA: ribbon-helix-helix protein, CopG family [Candidatus Binataceae bacterium]|jgi:hypothetical protein|nr:ribbon-helix-helix protein, CopG family [Candidatus Binataceae bacterium]
MSWGNQLTARVPPETYAEVQRLADRERRRLSDLIRILIEDGLTLRRAPRDERGGIDD